MLIPLRTNTSVFRFAYHKLTRSFALTSAPASMSILTTSQWPPFAACMSAVPSCCRRCHMEQATCSARIRDVRSYQHKTLRCLGVFLSLSIRAFPLHPLAITRLASTSQASREGGSRADDMHDIHELPNRHSQRT